MDGKNIGHLLEFFPFLLTFLSIFREQALVKEREKGVIKWANR